MKIILHWILATLAVAAAAYLLPGVSIATWQTAIILALVIGLINTLVKPIILFLTLPINILTLGLFTLVINGLLIMLTAKIVPGFYVSSFWTAVLFSIILWAINTVFLRWSRS